MDILGLPGITMKVQGAFMDHLKDCRINSRAVGQSVGLSDNRKAGRSDGWSDARSDCRIVGR